MALQRTGKMPVPRVKRLYTAKRLCHVGPAWQQMWLDWWALWITWH